MKKKFYEASILPLSYPAPAMFMFKLLCLIFAQGLIIAEAVSEAVKAAEKQAGDIKGFMDLSTEMAEDEGRIQGKQAGRAAGKNFIKDLKGRSRGHL